MSDGVSVEVHGLPELAAGTRLLVERIDEEAPKRFEDVAERQAAAVRSRVPRRSGALAGSVEATVERDRAQVGYSGAVPYDGWIDFGGTRGRPYIASGRYLFPTALEAGPLLAAAGEAAASDEIRGMRWASPS